MKKTLILLIMLFVINRLATTEMLLCIAPNNHIEFELAEDKNCFDQHESASCDVCFSNEHCNECVDIELSKISNIIIRQPKSTALQQLSDTDSLVLTATDVRNTNPSKTLLATHPLFSQSPTQKSINTTVLLI